MPGIDHVRCDSSAPRDRLTKRRAYYTQGRAANKILATMNLFFCGVWRGCPARIERASPSAAPAPASRRGAAPGKSLDRAACAASYALLRAVCICIF